MPDRTAEDWGRIAVALPGWRWMPGMRDTEDALRIVAPFLAATTGLYGGSVEPTDSGGADGWCRAWACNLDPGIDDALADCAPDPDDPATAGCLLALLGPTPSEGYMAHVLPPSSAVTKWRIHMNTAQTGPLSAYGSTLGRACIAAAEALGRWPGGAE